MNNVSAAAGFAVVFADVAGASAVSPEARESLSHFMRTALGTPPASQNDLDSHTLARTNAAKKATTFKWCQTTTLPLLSSPQSWPQWLALASCCTLLHQHSSARAARNNKIILFLKK